MVKKKKQSKKKTTSVKNKSLRRKTKKAKKKKTIRKSRKRDLDIYELADGYEEGTLTRKQEMEFWYHVSHNDIDHPDENKIWDVKTQTWKDKPHPFERFLLGVGAFTAIYFIYSLLALIYP